VLKIVESECVETSNEIALLKTVKDKSPLILQYFDDFSFMLFRCIITEYCPNGDLDACLSEIKSNGETVPLNQVFFWSCDLAAALVFLHDLGIVHRDIKPK
jgi:serine/threonine protein kinase